MHIILRQTLTEKEKTSLTQGIIIHAPAYTYYFFRKCNILQSLKVGKIRACRKTKTVTIIKIFNNTGLSVLYNPVYGRTGNRLFISWSWNFIFFCILWSCILYSFTFLPHHIWSCTRRPGTFSGNWKPFKNGVKWFLFHLQSSFRS